MKTLKRGDKGHEVGRLQELLNVKVDDDFGPVTESALKKFQRAHRLDDDGICGPLTWDQLDSDHKPSHRPGEIPVVHLTRKGTVKRSEANTRAFPLSEDDMPRFDGSIDSIHAIIDYLDVEKSARYRRRSNATFCNIYAYDYAYLMGAFLPRVFWTDSALKSDNFEAHYGKTVREMNANALYDWFGKFSEAFGWSKVASTTEAQELANEGRCVIIVAANKNRSRSGHITAVVPQNEFCEPVGSGGIIIHPVQSQAGAVNKKYFASRWWKGMEPVRIYVSSKTPTHFD